jgi:beta-glucosidase
MARRSLALRDLGGLLLAAACLGGSAQAQPVDQRVEALLQQMTLDEKLGQLTPSSGDWKATGPVTF